MRYSRNDDGFDRIATLDIETTHYDPQEGEVVSIGLGVHDRGTPASEATYEPYHRSSADDEGPMIEAALERLDELEADALVTYNGKDFDLEFLEDRLYLRQHDNVIPEIDTLETHVDVFADRKAKCDRTGEKWPKLEDCLATYDFTEPETIWNGEPVTNTRFGEELGPLYLGAVEKNDDRQGKLTEVINHYLTTDLEANLALYYGDIGAAFEPHLLGQRREFDLQ